jgi:hypothetical protein
MVVAREFNMDLRTQVKSIISSQYANLNKYTWWRLVAKEMSTDSAKERLVWFLDTAQIRREDPGSVTLEDLVALAAEFEVEFAGAGLKIKRADMEDTIGGIPGGAAMDQAAAWARQIGAQIVYWPQKAVAKVIRDNPIGYDGKTLFAVDHPLNPFNTSLGSYANLITGAVLNAAGLGSDAPAIHGFGSGAVSVDVALENVNRVIAYIGTIAQANGVDPRNLVPVGILVPPALRSRVQQLTKAKFIAQPASSGAGSGDVEAVIADMNLGTPAVAPELAAAFGGSNTSFYLAMASEGEEMAAVQYVNREPFRVNALTGDTDQELLNADEFLWNARGRNKAAAGHPFQLFRVDGA